MIGPSDALSTRTAVATPAHLAWRACGRLPRVKAIRGVRPRIRGARIIPRRFRSAADPVIACDRAVAHLAGALGVKAWVALPVGSDWRWLPEREDTPWDPTLRLFCQSAGGVGAGVREDGGGAAPI